MTPLTSLSNEELLARAPLARSAERKGTADVIAYLAEIDRRRLYLGEACSSLHAFCVERLGYSEEEAMKRMKVAPDFLFNATRQATIPRPRRTQREFLRRGRTVYFPGSMCAPRT